MYKMECIAVAMGLKTLRACENALKNPVSTCTCTFQEAVLKGQIMGYEKAYVCTKKVDFVRAV